MSKRMYVGNLSYQVTEEDIKELFGQVCPVDSVNFVRDRETGRMKGFGFVDIGIEDTSDVIARLNGKEVGGRALVVNEARPKTISRKW